METLQNFRIRINLDQTKRMNTATWSTRSCPPEPRAKSREISQSPGGDSAGAPYRPAWGLEGKGKDARRPHGPQPRQSFTTTEINDRLDTLGRQRLDKRPQLTHPATAHCSGSAIGPRSQPAWDPERKPDSCPPYPRPAPESVPSVATGHRQVAGRATAHRRPGSPNTLGRR